MSYFSLFCGSDLAVDFGQDAAAALAYVAENADSVLGADAALLVCDGEGMCLVALVDARKLVPS